MLEIVEKFVTVGGEAPLMGVPVFLIRFSGCNLSCAYCDTQYNREVNETCTAEELVCTIAKQLALYPALKVLFTGGEPLWQNRCEALSQVMVALPAVDCYIETNGSIVIDDVTLKNSHYIVDWKSPSSGCAEQFMDANLSIMRPELDCLKIVVNRTDLDWLLKIIPVIRARQPQLPIYVAGQWGAIEPYELAAFVLENRLPVSLSMQLHKIIWPAQERGV
jgi:7-carboxy-7-deazaguanine synthase